MNRRRGRSTIVTSYPDDPIASLLDVDLHAAFLRRDGHELLTVNHYGRVAVSSCRLPAAHMEPTGELQLLGDTERVVMAGDCFVTSSPRGEFTNDASQPGVFLFEPLPASWDEPTSEGARRLACDQALADWGVIGALAVTPHADRLAVAAGPRLGVFTLMRAGAALRLGECLWETALTFHCQWLHFDEIDRLWAGGHRVLGGRQRPTGTPVVAADSPRSPMRAASRTSLSAARRHRLGLRRRPSRPGHRPSRGVRVGPRCLFARR